MTTETKETRNPEVGSTVMIPDYRGELVPARIVRDTHNPHQILFEVAFTELRDTAGVSRKAHTFRWEVESTDGYVLQGWADLSFPYDTPQSPEPMDLSEAGNLFASSFLDLQGANWTPKPVPADVDRGILDQLIKTEFVLEQAIDKLEGADRLSACRPFVKTEAQDANIRAEGSH